MSASLVGSEMCIRDSFRSSQRARQRIHRAPASLPASGGTPHEDGATAAARLCSPAGVEPRTSGAHHAGK
eukprot:9442551-Alexandrium_andersonii.AAC.1